MDGATEPYRDVFTGVFWDLVSASVIQGWARDFFCLNSPGVIPATALNFR